MLQRWSGIFLLWAVGVLAAAQLGKMAALMPLLRQEFGLTLLQAGWLISLIEASGASFGIIAGLAIGRLGSLRALSAGLTLLTLAGLGGALAGTTTMLFTARLLESAGYLLIVIAAPSLIAAMADEAGRSAALALWSSFVPAGLALGAMLTGAASLFLSWRELFWVWTLVAATGLLATFRLPAVPAGTSSRFRLPPAPVWLLSAGFGCYTAVEVGVLALLPAYLNERWGLSVSAAGTVTGIASAATLLGAVVAARLLRFERGNRDEVRVSLCILFAGLLIPAVLLFTVFPPAAFGNRAGTTMTCLLAIALNAASGLVPAASFARLPQLLDRSRGQLADMAAVNGVFAQFGAAGALIGPPLLGFAAGRWGWPSVAPATALCTLFAIAFMLASERRNRRSAVALTERELEKG